MIKVSRYNREELYRTYLKSGPKTVKELALQLYVSEPTVRRDIVFLQEKGILTCKRGLVTLITSAPDQRVPISIRHDEQTSAKMMIAQKAIAHVKNGDVIMMDASTTASHLIPLLANFEKIMLITNGLNTSLEAVSCGIKTICIGGEATMESFSFIGPDAESTLKKYNADIAFFSCRGISMEKGIATDNSIMENNIRRIMMENSREKYLVCDRSKFHKTYLNTLCKIDDVNDIITD